MPMLSIVPPRHVPPAADSAANGYEIIVIDQAGDQALVALRNVHPLAAVGRQRRRGPMLIAAAAAAMCAAVGFGAGMVMGEVPPPAAPAVPRPLASVAAWSASVEPPQVEPLPVAGAAGQAPSLAGWVTSSDSGGRGVRVELLGTAGPVTTLAFELDTEPRMAMLRGVSSRAFDIEIGPVAGLVRPQELAAADGVVFIRRVSVHAPPHATGRIVRVRVNLDAPGQGNLRVVGRTIYADFAPRPSAS